MNVTRCDACGKELDKKDYDIAGNIKVSRRVFSWDESWWGRLDICAECFAGLKAIWVKSTSRGA